MLQTFALVAILATWVSAQDAYTEANLSDSNNDPTSVQIGNSADQNAYTTVASESYEPTTTSESQYQYTTTSEAETDSPTGSSPNGQRLADYVQIKFAADQSKCLAVSDTSGKPGTPVVLRDCDTIEPEARHETQWLIDQTEPSRVIARAFPDPFCLDAGDVNNRVQSLTISPCDYVNPAQIWQYTFKHLVIYGKTLSLDLPGGDKTDGGTLQTWDYTFGNTNQEWNIVDAPEDPPGSWANGTNIDSDT